ncbi:MAG: MFS transporter, partial [Deltaproteobacteria bacterium]|nr:MFS transporter [Deltaproteobacteria bacterium]
MRPPAKLGLLATLYFSQGLPFGFFSQALPAVMRQQGISLATIGLSTLLALPWGLKFLWAPLVDRTGDVRGGRRRAWLLPL